MSQILSKAVIENTNVSDYALHIPVIIGHNPYWSQVLYFNNVHATSIKMKNKTNETLTVDFS